MRERGTEGGKEEMTMVGIRDAHSVFVLVKMDRQRREKEVRKGPL